MNLLIDKKVEPVARPHQRILIHVRKEVEAKLREMEEADIIENINGQTPWVDYLHEV